MEGCLVVAGPESGDGALEDSGGSWALRSWRRLTTTSRRRSMWSIFLSLGGVVPSAYTWKGGRDEVVHILLRCHEHSGCSLLLGAGFDIDKALDFGLLAVGAWDIAVAADLFPVVSVVPIGDAAEGGGHLSCATWITLREGRVSHMTGRQNWGSKEITRRGRVDSPPEGLWEEEEDEMREKKDEEERAWRPRGNCWTRGAAPSRRRCFQVSIDGDVVHSWNGVCFFQGWFVALFRHGDWRLEIWERWREETTGAPRRAGRGRDTRGSPRPRYPAKKHELLWFWGAAHAKILPPGTSSRHPGKTPRARRATRCRLRDVADLGAKGPWFLGIYACVPRPRPPSDVMRRHSRCRICLLCLLCLFS